MKHLLLICLLVATATGSPIQHEHLNAVANDQGVAVVSVDKDVILSPGKAGDNFNAKSDSKGISLVQVGGVVKGSAENRDGEEFNAISKNKGVSQVRVLGGIDVHGLDPNATKFDAISEDGGVSTVQLGNVQIISGARQGRLLNSIAKEGNALVKAEDSTIEIEQGTSPSGKPSVDVLIKKKPVKKNSHDRELLGAAWGAAAVATQNLRPWEDLENDEAASGESDFTNNHIHAPVSDIFQDDDNTLNGPTESEIHDFPHETPTTTTHEDPPVSTTESSTLTIIGKGKGHLNANSNGGGSISVVNVKGSVSA